MNEGFDVGRTVALEPASSTTTGSASVSRGLPYDIVEGSVRRLGWTGLVYAFLFVSLYSLYYLTRLEDVYSEHHFALFTRHMILGVALGLFVCGLAWSRKVAPYPMLDFGLLFQVVGAFIIGVTETCFPIEPQAPIHGISSITVWVTFFVLVVPTTFWKSLSAALASAAMGPLGLTYNILTGGVPVPQLGQWVHLYASAFLVAVAAVALSRYVYSLGKQVSRAREMGSYELVDLLGKGGMGEVWRARHRMLVREAAIKLIRQEALCCDSEEAVVATRRRFEREAQATAALSSPHTVALYDYGVSHDGSFYYVMEMLDGLDMQAFIERFGPVRAERAVFWLKQICDSLAEAHAKGILHRDVKPKNLFVCRLGIEYDFVKVLDFGLAKLRQSADKDTQLTRDGTTTGTPAYMSPELAMGTHDIDARSDLYAVGCVAYWLVTGKLVFEHKNSLSMALAHVQQIPVPPSERTEIDVPLDLENLILRCLSKNPADRPSSARELSRLLSEIDLRPRWTQDKAEEWWNMHLPASVPAPAESVVHA
jgi:eukaryotic-like serine/threonine-protein kinase